MCRSMSSMCKSDKRDKRESAIAKMPADLACRVCSWLVVVCVFGSHRTCCGCIHNRDCLVLVTRLINPCDSERGVVLHRVYYVGEWKDEVKKWYQTILVTQCFFE